MSGGSYNYLYSKDPDELFNEETELEDMFDRLTGLKYADDAARETYELLLIIRAAKLRIQTIMDRLSSVFKAVEWWDSHDGSEDNLKKALKKYRGE